VAVGDFVTLDECTDYLAQVIPNNSAALDALPFLITAASKMIRSYIKRDIYQQDYTLFAYAQKLDGKGFSEIIAKQYPINSISRLSVSPTTILSVQNLSPTINQRATAGLNVTGDTVSGLNVLGLTLYRIASGVPTTDQSVLFATYITSGAAAAAVSALGNGWQGIAASGYANWASSDIIATTGAQNCLQAGQADFQACTQDVSAYDFDPLSGIIRLRNETFDPVFALMNLQNTSLLSVFPLGWRAVQIAYNAGFPVIPEPIQMATLQTIRDWVYQLQITPQYQNESDVDFSYTLGEFIKCGLPAGVKALLNESGFRSYRNF
jgi:hypothetical protein